MLSFSEYTQLDELTRQARLKMSRAARRTAKLRARKRMMRRKRRKSGEQLKLKAAKAARGMFKLSFSVVDNGAIYHTAKEIVSINE